MRTSIIDIGTKSIKHYIFEGKKEVFFKRESSIKLGEDVLKTNRLEEVGIIRAIEYVKKCLDINNKECVSKTIILGTDALRKAENSNYFIDKLKQETNIDIKIITHEEEAKLLGKAYRDLVKDNFAVLDVGGGSTEVIVFRDGVRYVILLAFGVNRIYQEFLKKDYDYEKFNNEESWEKVNEFLKSDIDKVFSDCSDLSVDILFIDGTLTFMTKQNNLLKTKFQQSGIKEHPFRMDMESYIDHIRALKDVGVKKLAENFPQDPGYADNFAIGQSIYFSIAKKLNVKEIYPSELQYTHGLIE